MCRVIIDYIRQRENPFTTLSSQPITNINTNEQLNVESNTFPLQCLKVGEIAYSHFNKFWLQEKTAKLFDTIPTTRTVKRSSTCVPIFDTKKETASFVRYIDYARMRNYDIKNFLHYGLTTTSSFLKKDDHLQKPRKPDLTAELKKLFEGRYLQSLPATVHERMTIIDFTEYARKDPAKKASLKTFFDLCNHLWSTFMHLSKDSTRIDIVFDLYHDKSIMTLCVVYEQSR